MSRTYAGYVQQGSITSAACFLGIGQTAASPISRNRIFEFEFGSSITPADYASKISIARFTSLPTGEQ